MQLGNGKWEHTSFNNRLQPTQIGLGTSGTDSSVLKLDYGYGTTTNNGNVMSQTITAPGLTLNQCYGYDSLNRVSTAEERSGGTTCAGTRQWKQAFTYDRFGNRNVDVANTTANVLGPNPTISQASNRFTAGQNYGYDNAGNLTSDPATNVNGIVYDAENRQTQYTKSGQATNSYYYDGDGHRVKKIDSSGTTVFVYNAGGQLIAEYTSGAPSGGGTSYLTSDHLGSTRVVMKSDGTTTTTTRHDFLPFGEEIQAGIGGRTAGQGYVADGVRQKFTQKERDNESGLDYFGARYYSSAQGRFTTVDPLLESARRKHPQTWNRYTYALNNPLRYVDPTGEDIIERTIEREYEFDYKNVKGDQNTTFHVQVKEVTVQYIDSDTGVVGLQSTNATVGVSAVTIGELSDKQRDQIHSDIGKISDTVKNIVEVSRDKGFNPAIALGIAAEETSLGTGPPVAANKGRPEKGSDVNPLQLSGGRATMDPRANIAGALDDFNDKSRGGRRSLHDTLDAYGGGKYPVATKVMESYINSIGTQTQNSFKQTYQDRVLRSGFKQE